MVPLSFFCFPQGQLQVREPARRRRHRPRATERRASGRRGGERGRGAVLRAQLRGGIQDSPQERSSASAAASALRRKEQEVRLCFNLFAMAGLKDDGGSLFFVVELKKPPF